MKSVFLSYRQESREHCARTRALGERLEKAGIPVVLDQFAQEREFRGGGPDEGWPRWSRLQAAAQSNKILIVASPGWFRAFDLKEIPTAGLGAATEAAVIEERMYKVGGLAVDIRMVEFDRHAVEDIPSGLHRFHRFLFPDDWDDLARWLGGQEVAEQPQMHWDAAVRSHSWVMANHESVRQAFAQLMTPEPTFRYLPIRGDSESGKSHITRQLLGNALRNPGLACGRFDCKGMTDADDEFQRFVLHLTLPSLGGGPTLTSRFNAALNALSARRQPTLMIFDTFEMAGDLERWVTETLLVSLIRHAWLRVVIAGQRVPEPNGFPWDAEAHKPVVLAPPAPEHWLEFARVYHPALTLEDVSRVHQLARGRGSLMYQLFGPAT